jgi:trehalose-6-phosphatase
VFLAFTQACKLPRPELLYYAAQPDVVAIYIGDDRTDEDAFRVLLENNQGEGCFKFPVCALNTASTVGQRRCLYARVRQHLLATV